MFHVFERNFLKWFAKTYLNLYDQLQFRQVIKNLFSHEEVMEIMYKYYMQEYFIHRISKFSTKSPDLYQECQRCRQIVRKTIAGRHLESCLKMSKSAIDSLVPHDYISFDMFLNDPWKSAKCRVCNKQKLGFRIKTPGTCEDCWIRIRIR
jgi:hypothetical protein